MVVAEDVRSRQSNDAQRDRNERANGRARGTCAFEAGGGDREHSHWVARHWVGPRYGELVVRANGGENVGSNHGAANVEIGARANVGSTDLWNSSGEQ